jgi:hypothetical protein
VVVKVMLGAAATVRPNVAVAESAFGVPASVTLKVRFVVPMPAAVGVPEITPAEFMARPAGRVPLVIVHAYGGIPPLAATVPEYAVPTVPATSAPVVTAGAAGTVMVAVAVFVMSATEVAVTVTVSAVLEAAGAVYVAALVVEPDRAPPPLTFQLTPALFLSCATVAERLTVFVASTVLVEGDTVTLGLALEPPQPDKRILATKTRKAEAKIFFKYTESSTAGSICALEAKGPVKPARAWRHPWSVCLVQSVPKW